MNYKKNTNGQPNFTIVTPGKCNCKCSFCFWKETDISRSFLPNLEYYVNNIPQVRTVSISGGEPTISPFFNDILSILNCVKYKLEKIVLTSNGTKLLEKFNEISQVVDFINISIHHTDPTINNMIFGNDTDLPNKEKLIKICEKYQAAGIPININVVVSKHVDECFILDFIDYAKEICANSITFRMDFNNETILSKEFFSTLFQNYKIIEQSDCPVCRTELRLIKGFPVNFKYSVIEPSNGVDYLFEAVMQPDGGLYEDWNFQKPIELIEDKKVFVSNEINCKYKVRTTSCRYIKEPVISNYMPHHGCYSNGSKC